MLWRLEWRGQAEVYGEEWRLKATSEDFAPKDPRRPI